MSRAGRRGRTLTAAPSLGAGTRSLTPALPSAITPKLSRPTGGVPVGEGVRERLSTALGHHFEDLRVHADAQADALARVLGARAFTTGSDVYFRAGEYAPETSAGFQLLTHEAAHGARRAAGERPRGVPVGDDLEVVPANDPSEQAAQRAADYAAHATLPAEGTAEQDGAAERGGHAADSESGATVVQRWPWSEDSKSEGGVLDSIGSVAGSWWEGQKKSADETWKFAKAASDVWDSVAPNPAEHNKEMEKGIDWAEDKVAEGTGWLSKQAKGTPFEGVANVGGGVVNQVAQNIGGGVKGVGDLAGMVSNAYFHPIDSAVGMAGGIWNMWEHMPLVGGGFKLAHGAFDLAAGTKDPKYGKNWDELNRNLAPGNQFDSDLDFWAGFGGGTKAWKERPFDAASRTFVNFLPMLMGIEEPAGGGKPSGGGSRPTVNPRSMEPPPGSEPPTVQTPGPPESVGPRSGGAGGVEWEGPHTRRYTPAEQRGLAELDKQLGLDDAAREMARDERLGAKEYESLGKSEKLSLGEQIKDAILDKFRADHDVPGENPGMKDIGVSELNGPKSVQGDLDYPNGKIRVNVENNPQLRKPYGMAEVIAHEAEHVHQRYQGENPERAIDPQQAREYQRNFEDYRHADDPRGGYWEQPVEVGARKAGNQFVESLLEHRRARRTGNL